MDKQHTLALIVGSHRRESVNRKLAQVAARHLEANAVRPDLIEGEAHAFPIYNGDLEAEGLPSGLEALARRLSAANGFIFVSPEYNGLPTPLMKNTIDWLTRTEYSVFAGKPAAILSASPGALGGMRGQRILRELLSNLNMLVIPQQYALRGAFEAFDGQGNLTDPKADTAVANVVKALADLAAKVG